MSYASIPHVTTIDERVRYLRAGSMWQKPRSGKTYRVIGFAIDSHTSGAVVIYKRENHEEWYTRSIADFLGDVVVADDGKSKTYLPKFEPLVDDSL